MSDWNPNLYLKFANERTQPSIDLISRIALAQPAQIVDLGCGPGNSTKALRQRWPTAHIVGVDNSPEMIAAATKADPAGKWVLADLSTWQPDAPLDLVFSNATLQWVKHHDTLLPRLLGTVAQGGALAMQMPDTSGLGMPVRHILAQVADLPQWRARVAIAKGSTHTERPSFYYDVLRPHCRYLELWETEYNHVLDSAAAIVEWISATSLRPYLDALDTDAHRQAFIAEMVQRVGEVYGTQYDGKVLFPFRRVFFIAYR
ncbi:MAG: methyltransferase domain-containing protein [Anaerolineae bacterium]|nr:methyltransferase domain-containing protein [Anaerolineae bacterium]